jgi:hypothetical protein
MPEKVMKEAEKQLKRLEKMHPDSAEAATVRTYLDWLVELPWSKSTKDNLDIKTAQKVLNKDHYDLEKVKERILEYLSVRKLKEKMMKYFRLLTLALQSLRYASEDKSSFWKGAIRVLDEARLARDIGLQHCTHSRTINALVWFSFGHGWLDAGVRIGLFKIRKKCSSKY